MKQIPNVFTLLNLVAGCFAVVFILQTGESLITTNEDGGWTAQLPEKIWLGSIFIFIAAALDFLDGFVARLFQAGSEMGKQLDSLADMVSFGLAPGLILYQLLRIGYIQQENGLNTSIWALSPAFLFTCAGAWRLARYNTDKETRKTFQGVPIPAAGLVVASFPLIIFYNYFNLAEWLINPWALYAIILALSLLMISKLPLIALKFNDASLKNNLPQIILIGIALIAAIFLQWLAVPIVFAAYIILSLAARKPQHG